MQATLHSSRPSQRRAPGGHGSPPQGNGLNSTMSTSGSGRRPESNLGKIEESVTNLLRATKELLETLTRWSRGQATEQDVSDVYVKLGSHFNIACRAFTAIGVETADLGNVPEILRAVLESTLSQPEASPQSLERYLPKIREIIIDLLQGLKRKQKKLAARPPRESRDTLEAPRPPDIPIAGEYPPPTATREHSMRRSRMEEQHYSEADRTAPPRTSSLPQGPMPTIIPYQMPSEDDFISPGIAQNGIEPHPTRPDDWPNPPPPPKQDALAALQRGDALERRASRRYSAHHAKLTGIPPSMMPMLPSNPSVVPRARESREAINAMRNSMQRSRASLSRRDIGDRPPSSTPVPQPIQEDEATSQPDIPELPGIPSIPPPIPPPPVVVEPETPVELTREPPILKAGGSPAAPQIATDSFTSPPTESSKEAAFRPGSSGTTATNKELTLFLQLGRSVKKTVIQEGVEDLSINSLRLLFISKFSYNPPPGDNFPEIYLQDTPSGVRYELEDVHDIKDRSVLCLNIEVLDEVKRHIDDGLTGLKGTIEGLHKTIEVQGQSIQQIVAKQDESTRSISELSKRASAQQPSTPTTPTPAPAMKGKTISRIGGKIKKGDHGGMLEDIKSTQKDIAVLRQTYDGLNNELKAEMHSLRKKTESLKQIPGHAPSSDVDSVAYERTRLKAGKDQFTIDCDNLVAKVDDLQDTIEELRKDVVSRGVRPLGRQLEQVDRDTATARKELRKMGEYLKRERRVWNKLWERMLEVVCEEQQFFKLQDELYADLQDDLDKASQTFQLVEECTQQQLKAPSGSMRTTSRGFIPQVDETVDPSKAKDSVLGDIRALQPNHGDRIEAIERAEKARQQDLAGRTSPFKQELGKFVEGSKLKKSGGFMEAERLRTQKDELHRKNQFKKLDSQGDTASNASDDIITTDNLLNSISADQKAAAEGSSEGPNGDSTSPSAV